MGQRALAARPCRFRGFRRGLAAVWVLDAVLSASTLPVEPPVGATGSVRPVRVLVSSDLKRLRFRCATPLSILDVHGTALGPVPSGEWVTVTTSSGRALDLAGVTVAGGIRLEPEAEGAVSLSLRRHGEWSATRRYPGTLRLVVGDDGLIDAINTVDIEPYTACVVANEVWPTFATEAYRAQAIAVRTFVLYQMGRRTNSRFDIAASQGSQVYRGLRSDVAGRRAADATAHTRGIVSTWLDGTTERLFSAYYSAACGGVSQSAAIFGSADDVPPLAGGVRCDFCRIAPGDTYRWGPVALAKADAWSRLLARYPAMARLGSLTDIEAAARTPTGRPTRLRITGSTGESHEILAERFRLAVGGDLIKSTDFHVEVSREEVRFTNGRGHGHGLGLCQWGMQGQAQEGASAGEILRYYFPGSRLTRAY